MPKLIPISLAAGITAAISGCSSSDPTPRAPVVLPAVTATGYQTLASGAATTSGLKGHASNFGGSKATPTYIPVTGTLTHNTGALGIRGGKVAALDADGPNTTENFVDGVNKSYVAGNGETMTLSQSINGNYVGIFTATDRTNPDGGRTLLGVVGIGTAAADMPPVGTATYRGDTLALLGNADGLVGYSGTSTISANFATNKVNVDMDNLQISERSGSIVAPTNMRIYITGMDVNGADFSGGTIMPTDLTGPVDFVGPGTRAAAGSFYGPTTGTPAEAAGSFSMDDGANFISGVFSGY